MMGDWILLSGQDPSTFFIDKIYKFCSCQQQQRDRISTDHLQQQDQICAYPSNKESSRSTAACAADDTQSKDTKQ
jgi:hypothetical protein